MTQFAKLQQRLFPVYFRSQVGLAALTLATVPGHGSLELLSAEWPAIASLAVTLGMALLNQQVYGPRTATWMLKRIQQGACQVRHGWGMAD